ncbi:MAG: hypothetical protein OXF02_07830 [Simkaniaceae bacterium]|nr:hypothetical protein [Simkaniaceae bacterium]
MVGPIILPSAVVIGPQMGNIAPVVVNQPAVAPAVVNQPVVAPVVAPAVAVNNVTQGQWRGCKKKDIVVGAVVGEIMVGAGCVPVVGGGVTGIAVHMGTTTAVAIGAGLGTGIPIALLCIPGSVAATIKVWSSNFAQVNRPRS